MRMQWTQAQCQELERLWTAGMSATDIGTALGFSRGAVLGKLSRLQLMGRGGAMRKDCAPDCAPVRRIPF
jgi:GcrA cell cycle regulator